MTGPLPFSPDEVERSLSARFARVAADRASAVAVAHRSGRLTYEEVDRRTDALAEAIARRVPAHAAPVVTLVEDPVSAILSMVATWKAGKLCVPLNPHHPPDYLARLVRDAEARLLLADGGTVDAIGMRVTTPRLRVDALDLGERTEAPRPTIRPEDPACLIYTSGSTGEPKGVLRSHRCMLYRARWAVLSHGIGPTDRLSLLHSVSSSPGVRDLLAAFFAGATLLPWDMKRAGPRALAAWIERERVTVLGSAVSMFRPLLTEPDVGGLLRSVRVVHLGSEPLYRQDVVRFRERFARDCLLIAAYGSTEAVPLVELHIRHDTPLPAGRVPAGYPLDGVELLMLDDEGQPVAVGEPGEVAVRSRYLADGYWRRPDLTSERFLPDPANPVMRIYRTGDVGRLGPDGCLALLGRKDEQVKVRGYRVHPGQVEAALTEHEAIRQAVVTASTGPAGDARLVAYLVPEAAPPPQPGELRRFLRDRLPAHLVPSAFVALDAMPLSANGKTDRAALPPPPVHAPRPEPFVAPRSPLEHQIAGIWEDLFGIAPIGATDDFFDLGGDSLLAAALVTGIEESCGRTIVPSVLLEASTVEALAAVLLHEDVTLDEPLTVLRASGARAPLVFVHNDRGSGLYTHALGRALDLERPIFAIHLHGLAGRPLPDSVEEIAAERVDALREVWPHGPYVLGGHCYGGIVALEMARQLRAAGEAVEALVMIDTAAPGRLVRALHRASGSLRRLGVLSLAGQIGLVTTVDRATERVVAEARSFQVRLAALARAGIRRQAAAVERRVAAAVRGLGRLLGADGLDPAAHPAPPEPGGASSKAYRDAIRRYVPGAYDGPVALFRAEELPAASPDLGWRMLLPQLEVEVVPGDHHTCVTRHVGAFASRLEARLQRAR